MELIDSWFNAEGEYLDKITLVRGRDNLFNFKESGIYTDRIEIEWTYSSPDDSGFPSNADSDLMTSFEEQLIANLEKDLHSILSFVYTWNNSKTWFWYTKSYSDFNTRLNSALTGFDRLPIEIKRINDPDWFEYMDMMISSGLINE
jgi:hypothetical protein